MPLMIGTRCAYESCPIAEFLTTITVIGFLGIFIFFALISLKNKIKNWLDRK